MTEHPSGAYERVLEVLSASLPGWDDDDYPVTYEALAHDVVDALVAPLTLDRQAQEAIRALLSLVRYDDLASRWIAYVPAELWPDEAHPSDDSPSSGGAE